MKQRTSFAWLFALAFGVGLTFSSCKDDVTSNGGLTPEEQVDKGSERAEALLSVLSMTAGVDSLPNDWYKADYTVEPIVGEAHDSSNPYVRYVAVSSIEEADETYKSMISGNVTGTVKDDTWTKDGIGTLSFKVQNQPDVTATVDVNVQQLPHLRQIRFVPPSVVGDNANFKSYYHFGDVVKLKTDGSYWICVRPTNSTAGKKLSQWVSFYANTNAGDNTNFKTYTKSGRSLTMPYALGNKSNSEKHIPDFFSLYKALKENYRTNDDYIANKRPEVGTKESYTIGGVTLPVDSALAISDFWRQQGFWDSQNNAILMPKSVREVFERRVSRQQDMNVFYHGHHYLLSPDVHMMTLPYANYYNSNKVEIKFAFPTTGAVSFAEYATNGQSAACHNLAETLPEEAFVIRYKNGPELSGQKSLIGNDKYPEQSFAIHSPDLLEDVYVYTKEMNKLKEKYGFFVTGDRVKKNAIGDAKEEEQQVCVKSAVGSYKTYNAQRRSLFITLANRTNAPLVAIEDEEARVIAFNILNSYLLQNNKFSKADLQRLGIEYKKSLEELGQYLNTLEELYGKEYPYAFEYREITVPILDILFYVNKGGVSTPLSYRVSYTAGTYKYEVFVDAQAKEKYAVPVWVYEDFDAKDSHYSDVYWKGWTAEYKSRQDAQKEAADFYYGSRIEGTK